MCYNEILGCFHGGVGLGENLHTIVVVRRKMVHTSNKHQPNWFKFTRYSCCIISYPNVLSILWFPWQQASVKYCLVMKMWFFEYKMIFYIFNSSSISWKSIFNLFKMSQRCIKVLWLRLLIPWCLAFRRIGHLGLQNSTYSLQNDVLNLFWNANVYHKPRKIMNLSWKSFIPKVVLEEAV